MPHVAFFVCHLFDQVNYALDEGEPGHEVFKTVLSQICSNTRERFGRSLTERPRIFQVDNITDSCRVELDQSRALRIIESGHPLAIVEYTNKAQCSRGADSQIKLGPDVGRGTEMKTSSHVHVKELLDRSKQIFR